jgi:hypothetical protein
MLAARCGYIALTTLGSPQSTAATASLRVALALALAAQKKARQLDEP